MRTKVIIVIILLAAQFGFCQPGGYQPDNIDTVSCSFTPQSQQWAIVRGDSSQALSHMYAQPYVGDIDHDGHNEVVTVGYSTYPRKSYSFVIYNDQMVMESTYTTPEMYVYGGYPLAIADVDNDGIAEIFVHASNGYLYCYTYNGTSVSQKWQSSTATTSGRAASLIIADVNSDGVPDICAIDKIYNAQTGMTEINLPEIIGQSDVYVQGYATMPVFADMDNDGTMELVGGDKVYKLTITNATGIAGNSATLWKTLIGSGVGDGLTSVADIDLDGYLDVVVVRMNYLYVWKPYSGVGSNPTLVGSYYYTSNTAGSRALITDVDNDGYPEVLFTYVYSLACYKYNSTSHVLQQMWQQTTSDASGATTMTAFDFNQDSNVEIVYRDQSNLRILNGLTGNNITSFGCVAPTAVDYPVIVDLDGNGEAEIIASSNNFEANHDMHAKLIVYRSPVGNTWAPARKVWNQHAYNVVSINNDLTVPQVNYNPTTTFTDPNGVLRRPFNNFLQQATTLDQYGRPYYAVADAVLSTDTVMSTCDSITIELQMSNRGAVAMNAPYEITVYKDVYRGQVIRTYTMSSALAADSTCLFSLTLTSADLALFEPITQLVVALNDAGTGIAQHGEQQSECDTTNNLITVPYHLNTMLEYQRTVCLGDNYVDDFFTLPADSLQAGLKDYYLERPASEGYHCDSTIILHLIVNQPTLLQFEDTVCQDIEYHNHGFDVSNSQTNTIGTLSLQHESTTVLGCDSTVQLTLQIISGLLEVTSLTSDFCDEYSAILSAQTNLQHLFWNTGDTTSTIEIDEPGTYTVIASEGDCSCSKNITIAPCNFNLFLPNAISPSNHDGINDYFFISEKITHSIQELQINIFNRWGELVYNSTNKNFQWDGSFHGKTMPNMVYSYVIKIQIIGGRQFVFRGNVMVL